MDCDFRRNFYLISNGEVNCGRDEPGYDLRVRIHDSNGGVDFSRWEKQFSAVSKKLANKKVPFDKCVTCKLLWPASFYEGSHSRKMRTIVVEPTVLCNISCTNCTPIKQRKYLREETILTFIKRSNSENCSDEVMPEFRLVPANHLTLEEDGSYVSIGNDPILSVFYNRLPTGDGFHQFQVKIDFEEYAKFDKGLEAQLFFDTGKGFNEEESVRAAYSEGIVTFLVPSINPVVALRLDPAETECKFTIVGFNCLSNDHKG